MSLPISKKICLLGDFAVGKTSLIRQFVDRQFSDQYLSTVGVKISRKMISLGGEKNPQKPTGLQLLIWDIEGSTQFKSIALNYLQGARGAVIVADVSRLETLEQLPHHMQNYVSINPQGRVIIALNKSDLVDEATLKKLTEKFSVLQCDQLVAIYTTSAKTGHNVDLLFQELADRIMQTNESLN
jgi:small GTP-binding protein